MKTVCMCLDPEAGMYRDDGGGSYRYEDTGKTLEEAYPEQYCRVPRWTALLVSLTAMLHGRAIDFAYRRRI